ncbi:hypothetical protein QOT17_006442 [Balamuthia mandrillaris]
MAGYKAVMLCKEGQTWAQWDASGRAYGIAHLEFPPDAEIVVPNPKAEHQDTVFIGKRRAARATITKLVDLEGNEVDGDVFGRSDFAWTFLYKKGGQVGLLETETESYEKMKDFRDLEKTCTPGIHFFDTEEGAKNMALFWKNIHQNA